MWRRAAALWIVLFAAYAATIGLDSFGDSDYGGDEPHYLLAAESFVEDGSPDLRDEYARRAYESFYPIPLEPHGSLTEGRLHEPHGVGFPLLIAPAYAIGGPKGVEVFLAALTALAVALAYLLALRVVPDPWALGATVACGLSPPLLAYSTAVYPETAAAAALCGAMLLALRVADAPSRRVGWSCFALVAMLPWLGTKYLLPGLVVAFFAFRRIRASRRPVLALTCAEIVGFSVALYVGINEGLYGGLTPYAAGLPGETATGAGSPFDYLERTYRLVALFIDRHYGLLRWAPVFALALVGGWRLWRERRSGLARAIPAREAELRAGTLCAAVAGTQLALAAFLAPEASGFWFPGRHLVAALPAVVPLVALGLRRAPRIGALLALVGIAASVWLWIDVRFGGGGLVVGLPDAPWGPLLGILPNFEPGAVYPYVLAGLIGAAAAAAIAVSERRRGTRTAP